MGRTVRSNLHRALFFCVLCIAFIFVDTAYCRASDFTQIEPGTFKFMRVTSGDATCSSYVKAANIAFSTKKYNMGISMLLQYENAECLVENPDGSVEFNLGVLYENGYRVAKNIDTAISHYKKSAHLENVSSYYALGCVYADDTAVKNSAEAVKWFELGAEKGDAESISWLGTLYFQEEYAMVDYEKASKYFTVAAKRNDPIALFYLGRIYYEGLGKRQNKNLAFEYFEKSAAQGIFNAAFYLSWIYYHEDSHKDIVKAYFWLKMAIHFGLEDKEEAEHMAALLGAELSGADRKVADMLVEEKIKEFMQ